MAYGQRDSAHVIPPQVMIQIVKDVERGKACEIEVQMLLERLVIAENKETSYNAILIALQISLLDCEAIYQEEKKGREIERRNVKKARFERNIVGGVSLVIIILLIL
jgi:hypothetical protein